MTDRHEFPPCEALDDSWDGEEVGDLIQTTPPVYDAHGLPVSAPT